MNNKKILNSKNLYYGISIVLIIIYHPMIDTSFGDAVATIYAHVLEPGSEFLAGGNNWLVGLWNLSVHQWNVWSGRQVMEVFETLFATLPIVCFLIVDSAFDLLIVYCLDKLSPVKNEKLHYLVIGFFLSTYYFAKLGSAGYVCTCIVYSWTGACILYILLNMKRLWDGEKIKVWQTILSFLAMILAFNQEQCCGMMFIISFCFILETILEKRKVPFQYYVFIAYSVFQLIIVAICPGNANRSLQEASAYSDFAGYSLPYKVYLGIWNTYRGWIKSPYTVVAVASSLLFLVVLNKGKWAGTRKWINIAVAGIVFIFNVLIWYPDYYINLGTFGDAHNRPIFLFETMVFVGILWIVFELVGDMKFLHKLLLLGVICAIFASKVIMGFSPTFIVSGERTTFFFSIGIFAVMQYVFAYSEEKIVGKTLKGFRIVGFIYMILVTIVHLWMLSQGILY